MSDSLAVFHGHFGRVCLYNMDRGMVPHGHREGHLIFHVQGPPGTVMVDGKRWPMAAGQAVAVSPWQAHFYEPIHASEPTLALVTSVRPGFWRHLGERPHRSASGATGSKSPITSKGWYSGPHRPCWTRTART